MITFLLSYIWMGLNFGVASVETHIVCVICIDSQWTWYRAAFICQIYRDPELSHPWSCVVYNQRHHRQMTQHSLALIWRMVDSISIAWALSLKNGKLLKLCHFDTVFFVNLLNGQYLFYNHNSNDVLANNMDAVVVEICHMDTMNATTSASIVSYSGRQ